MYNQYLETFVAVAENGSLNRASRLLYRSPTALMKQINQLEETLDLVLFIRTNKGLQLTESGKSFYADAKYMLGYSHESVERARRAVTGAEIHIRVGTSLMNPAQEAAELLCRITQRNPEFHFQIVPFHDYRGVYAQTLSHLGEQIDVILGAYGLTNRMEAYHSVLPLSSIPVCVAVPARHPLAGKAAVDISELQGERLFITEPGESDIFDKIRHTLQTDYPGIQLINMKSFDLTLFNQCELAECALLTLPLWAAVHPTMKVIRVNWDYHIPYGISYPLHPSVGIRAFIKCARREYSALK